jgi:hypothetical protein
MQHGKIDRSHMKFSWGVIYLLLWVYRSAYSILAQIAISQLTSLGDSGKYQDGAFGENGSISKVGLLSIIENPREAATIIADGLGIIFSMMGGGSPFAANIGFQTIAFIGIVSLLRAAPPKMRTLLLILTMMPSFTIWSSVAGKEAVVVFAIGILSGLLIHIYRGTARLKWWHVLPVLIVLFFKNHYTPALVFLFVGTFICARVQQKALLVLIAGMISLSALYLFQERLGQEALEVSRHFNGLGSSRPVFWSSPDDVLTRAPLGMFLGFFGPTLNEVAFGGPLQLASFIESAVLLAVLALAVLRQLPSMPVYSALMGGFSLFWILFATYPLGVMNAGSAIRYRTGYELLILVLITVIMSRQSYVSWTNWLAVRRFTRATRPPERSAAA